VDNERSQLTETQQAINAMIAGAFRVPTWKIGDLTKANYSNMEAGELAYVTSTLDPLVSALGGRDPARPAHDTTVRAVHGDVRSQCAHPVRREVTARVAGDGHQRRVLFTE
jgi:hypothetical protein